MGSAESLGDGLIAQHRLLLAVIDADWATRLDHKVAAVIIERYYREYGNARASLRFVSQATRSDRSNVIESIRRLCSMGVLSVAREGRGTRPTEYNLNFGYTPSGGAEATASSGGAETTSSGGAATTASGSSGSAATTESYLLSPADGPADSEGRTSNAAPGGGGPSAAPPVGIEGFEELYEAYGVRLERAKALAAFQSIAPSGEVRAQMIEAATRWRAAYDSQGREPTMRKRLATWLTGQCWLEDGPVPLPRERKRRTAKDDGDIVRITNAKVLKAVGQDCLVLDYDVIAGPEAGASSGYTFLTEKEAEKLERFLEAAGLSEIEDLSEFAGVTLTRKKTNRGEFYFVPPPPTTTQRGARHP